MGAEVSRISNPPNSIDTRIRQFDGLRAVAIVMVLIHHSLHVPLLWVGVDIFFVLSGFLITSILLDRKHRGRSYFSYFYTRRAFRILPPYAVAIVLAAFRFGPSFLHYWPYFAFFAMNIFAALSIHTNMVLPLWSLAVEEQFYFVWPLIVLLLPERFVLRAAVLGILITPLLRVLATPLFSTSFPIYFLTPFRADLLCAGAALAVLWRSHRDRVEHLGRRFGAYGVLAGFGLMAALQAFPIFRIASNTRESNGLIYSLSLLGSTSLVTWSLVDRGWLHRLLTRKPIRYIGQISYMVYLVHLIFFEWMQSYTGNKYIVAFAGSALTIVFAALSWQLMERPLIRLAARLAPGSPPPPAPL